jgi:flagellar assembly protein FliH
MTSSSRGAALADVRTATRPGDGIIRQRQTRDRVVCNAWQPPRHGDPSRFGFAQAQLEDEAVAELLLLREQAEMEAKQLIATAERTAEAMARDARETAYRLGHEEGLAAGRAEAERESTAQVHRLLAIAEQAAIDHDRLIQTIQTQAVALSLAVARKVMNDELRTDPWLIARLISTAMEKLAGERIVRLRLCADDVALVTRRIDQLGIDPACQIVADPSLGPGDCIAEAETRHVDARLDALDR